jgi:hypothetical protein
MLKFSAYSFNHNDEKKGREWTNPSVDLKEVCWSSIYQRDNPRIFYACHYPFYEVAIEPKSHHNLKKKSVYDMVKILSHI